MTTGTEKTFFGFFLLLYCFFFIGTQTTSAKKDAPAKQYIYSRSTSAATSSLLGLSAVPAYVILPDGSRRGIYITQTMASGLWREMGLRPGMLLLTMGNRTVESARIADEIASKNQGTSFDFSYVKMQNGEPVLSHGHYVPYNGGLGGVGADGNYYPPGKKNLPEYSVSELESYMIDPDGRSPQDRARQAGISVGVNENLAFQTRGLEADKKLVEAAEAQMMNEPPNQMNHRGNILHPARQFVGVGIARNTGVLMMVQELTDQSP